MDEEDALLVLRRSRGIFVSTLEKSNSSIDSGHHNS
jgi:hypothetical protein